MQCRSSSSSVVSQPCLTLSPHVARNWVVWHGSSSSSSLSSAVGQPCLDPQSTCCQELNGVAWVFFFFCSQSAGLRPSVHMLPGNWWCGTDLPPFPTTCWWLTHPASITGVSVSARWNSPWGCGGPSVLLLCNHRVQSPWCQFALCVLAGYCLLGRESLELILM